MKIHALIPARSGSKGIFEKNIKIYKQKPLIAHSIILAKNCPLIEKVIVSTDSEKFAKISRNYGAETPFLREKKISDDLSLDIECFQDYLNWLNKNKKDLPDILIHLRATYPERNLKLLETCINKYLKIRNTYTSLRTVAPVKKSPYKMYKITNDILKPLFNEVNGLKEPYNNVRQNLPICYFHNGCIDIMNRETIEKGSMTGSKIYPFIMDNNEDKDIDTLSDWNRSLSSNKINP